ncbi:Pyroglutamylated RFamide peptide receptor [Melipona quadrifasciata]|uniref:Pyroglutamylated RFamide peptide receptor n=1 Tax=Melipona quadrifasciata TaxID=166423 RepID=A0A0M8ZR69_9HYME|nr:Pyroglutamylated RFamide peptide receptor [Melipona quadrifasciata]
MLSTVSSVSLELNSSWYTTVTGNSGFNALSVIKSENTSERDLYMLPAYIRTTSMVACIVVMVLGIIGNLMLLPQADTINADKYCNQLDQLVPIVVFRGKDMRNSTNIFLVNLSVADLCVLLICTPTVLVEVNSGPEIWLLGEYMCKAVPFVELTVAHASVLTILAISFERYMCTKAKATFLCFVAWIAAALCTSPIIWVSQYQEVRVKESKNDQDARNFVPVCLTMADTSATVVFFLLLVILFYVAPLLILLVLYTFIVGQLMPDSGNVDDSYHARAKKHAITMLLSVVVSFFVCLSPYRILIFYIVVAPAEQITAIDRDTFFAYLSEKGSGTCAE